MADRAELLNSIAATIQTYREGQIPTPDAAHVNRWVEQFPHDQQLSILTEIAPLMERCVLKEDWIRAQMQRLARKNYP